MWCDRGAAGQFGRLELSFRHSKMTFSNDIRDLGAVRLDKTGSDG